jgi:uncharacterized protein (TIGR03118 family)
MGRYAASVRLPRAVILLTVLAAATAALLIVVGQTRAAGGNSFTVHNLVSDGFVPADHTDPNLVNGWGITRGPTTPWWVSDEGTDVSTLYQGNGTPVSLVVKVPGGPTGTVFNGTTSFVLRGIGPARFLFATLAGTIRAWNPSVAPTEAVIAANRSNEHAIYTGLAIGSTSDGDRLYAADFHNARVDVFNSSFKLVLRPGAFRDPNLPEGYAPFGIQNIGGSIYVAYAKQDADREEEVAGDGLGLVDVYDANGTFLRRAITTGGALNAPWGLALAPAGFGEFGGDLLVGNFGNGWINAYRVTPQGQYQFHAALRMTNGQPIVIDGLWGIGFGNDSAAGPSTSLFFAAGPDDEQHGLFGVIAASP